MDSKIVEVDNLVDEQFSSEFTNVCQRVTKLPNFMKIRAQLVIFSTFRKKIEVQIVSYAY